MKNTKNKTKNNHEVEERTFGDAQVEWVKFLHLGFNEFAAATGKNPNWLGSFKRKKVHGDGYKGNIERPREEGQRIIFKTLERLLFERRGMTVRMTYDVFIAGPNAERRDKGAIAPPDVAEILQEPTLLYKRRLLVGEERTRLNRVIYALLEAN